MSLFKKTVLSAITLFSLSLCGCDALSGGGGQYAVTFYLEGGSDSFPTIQCADHETIHLPDTKPISPPGGKAFLAWSGELFQQVSLLQ